MGLELPTAAILGSGAALGGLGGFIGGLAGTPDQKQSTTSTTKLPELTDQERQLQEQSLAQYLQQLQLGGQYEQGIGAAQGLQGQAQQAMSGVLGGSAYQMTPQEQANVQALRDAMVAQGQTDVNRAMEQGTMLANRSAAARGLRGQAAMQLQGDVMRAGAEQIGDISRQANQFSAQQAINLPYQRVASQSPFIQQGASMADLMRLQAMQNRMAAQSPFLMQMLNQNRMAQGTQTQNQTLYGQPGNIWSGIAGAMGGAGSGLGMGGNVLSGIGNFQYGNSMANRYAPQQQPQQAAPSPMQVGAPAQTGNQWYPGMKI